MPTEPERDIEKTLRAFAKKRREEAGAPMELHPATRKLLQGEAARLKGRPPEKSSFWTQIFGRSWPQMALRVSVLVLLVSTAAFLVVQSLPKTSHKFQLAEMRPRDEQAAKERRLVQKEADAARLPAATLSAEAPARRKTVADASQAASLAKQDRISSGSDVNGGKSAAVSAKGLAGAASVASAPAPSVNSPEKDKFADRNAGNVALKPALPESAPAVAGTLDVPTAAAAPPPPANFAFKSAPAGGVPAAGLAGQANRHSNPAELADGLALNSALPAAASTVMPPDRAQREIKNEASNLNANSVTQQFVRAGQPAKMRKSLGLPGQLVLSSFRVEQTGNQIRIIDSDGSVYSGVVGQTSEGLTTQPGAQDQKTTVTRAARENASAPAGTQTGQTNSLSLGGMLQPAPDNFFRVSGTNLSLNQPVVFSGNFVPNLQSPPAPAKQSAGSTPAENKSPAPVAGPVVLPLLNSRVQGRAVIGGTNQIEINALPVKP